MQFKQGATRYVFLIRQYAIKIPRCSAWKLFLHGLLANMQECLFAKAGWQELCPVLWSLPGGFLLVMPRCEPITAPLTKDEYLALVEHPDYTVPAEHKQDSFGIYQGRLVAIDYGS